MARVNWRHFCFCSFCKLFVHKQLLCKSLENAVIVNHCLIILLSSSTEEYGKHARVYGLNHWCRCKVILNDDSYIKTRFAGSVVLRRVMNMRFFTYLYTLLSPRSPTMPLIEIEQDRNVHPVDIIEHIASINDWLFDRDNADEISITVKGGWSDYHVSFTWMEDIESLHLACAFDLKVPEARKSEIKQLIALINEQLWIGHFDIWNKEGVVLFRNSHMLVGGADVSPLQCEALLRSATESCDLYYKAFQFVVWAGKSAPDALAEVMFETIGEA